MIYLIFILNLFINNFIYIYIKLLSFVTFLFIKRYEKFKKKIVSDNNILVI